MKNSIILKKLTAVSVIAFVFAIQIPSLALAMASRPADPNAPPPPVWVQFFPMIVMVAVFYLLLIRPQMRQRKERESMMNTLKKGDRVVTQGGLLATVVGVNQDSIDIKLNEETKVKIRKSAITEVLREPTAEPVVSGK